MQWNWQQPDWPRFSWSAARLAKAEEQFLLGGGVLLGAVSHLDGPSRERLTVESMSEEAVSSSEIEGELLDRDSVQSSIRRELGLSQEPGLATPAEHGIAEMTVNLYREFEQPLDDATLCAWHRMLMRGRRDLRDIGCYRTHAEPMQIVSGKVHDPTVHFEAPPSEQVRLEMDRFLEWFRGTAPTGPDPLPALTRAGMAHLHFESIHPFEDGNGRIGRAISEKALAQSLGRPTLTALGATILVRRRSYYDALLANNKANDIGEWLAWFAGVALEAQQRTRAQVELLINKTKLLDRLRDELNERQRVVVLRVLREAPRGLERGLSAGAYASMAKTSPATATRDLADLVDKGAFRRTGARRHVRYHLTIALRQVTPVSIDDAGNIVGLN